MSYLTNLIKSEFFQFYIAKFDTFSGSRIITRSFRFWLLDLDQVFLLDSIPPMEEVRDAAWACGSDRVSGPYGFTFSFIKRYWELVQHDVYKFVLHFFQYPCIPSGCNSSFITLIPKVVNHLLIKDYRPITLIGIQYKVIAKLLALRLAKVVDSMVSMEQSALFLMVLL